MLNVGMRTGGRIKVNFIMTTDYEGVFGEYLTITAAGQESAPFRGFRPG
jgi:hypothetical protein